MKRISTWSLTVLILLAQALACPAIEARIKDIARLAGLEGVDLIGYGVVIGLSGTGDKDLTLTKQTIANLMEQFNITINITDIKSKNVATVMVTAHAPAFHQEGDRIMVQVSSMGDAGSLEGGVLLMTPLLDPEGQLYALAQGPLTVGGFSVGAAGAGGETVSKNITTVGTIPEGALLRKGQNNDFYRNGVLQVVLRQADFTTATRVATAINNKFEGSAVARDAGNIMVRIPQETMEFGQAAAFVSALESIAVTPDTTAKIMINERTGTIVMGADVHIGQAVVAHGNLTVNITSRLTAYMPEPFTDAKPVVLPETTAAAREDKAKIMLMPGTTTVQELADVLNQLGATPRDLVSILQALQQAGALQMQVVTM